MTQDRPNATALTNEAFLLFSLNKTLSWLSSKSKEEQAKLLHEAKLCTKDIKKKFSDRKDEIHRIKAAALAKGREEKAKKVQRQFKEREKMTNDVLYFGLWQSVESVHANIANLSKKKGKIDGIYAQLKFRKNVLKQPYDDLTVFNKSCGGKDNTIEQLTNNLLKLVEAAMVLPEQIENMPLLVGKHIIHSQMVEGNLVHFRGYVINT